MPKAGDEPQGALTWRFSVLLPGYCTMGLAQEKAAEPRLVAHVSRGQARGLGPCNEHVTGGLDQELACQAANHSDGNPAARMGSNGQEIGVKRPNRRSYDKGRVTLNHLDARWSRLRRLQRNQMVARMARNMLA